MGKSDSGPLDDDNGREIWLVSGRSDTGKKYGTWLEYQRHVFQGNLMDPLRRSGEKYAMRQDDHMSERYMRHSKE